MVKGTNTKKYTNNNNITKRAKSLKDDAVSFTAIFVAFMLILSTGGVFETRTSLRLT